MPENIKNDQGHRLFHIGYTYWCALMPCWQSQSCGVCATKHILVIIFQICINQKCFSAQTIVQRRSNACKEFNIEVLALYLLQEVLAFSQNHLPLIWESITSFCIYRPSTGGWALCSTPSFPSSPHSSGCSTSPWISCPAVIRRTWQLDTYQWQFLVTIVSARIHDCCHQHMSWSAFKDFHLFTDCSCQLC